MTDTEKKDSVKKTKPPKNAWQARRSTSNTWQVTEQDLRVLFVCGLDFQKQKGNDSGMTPSDISIDR